MKGLVIFIASAVFIVILALALPIVRESFVGIWPTLKPPPELPEDGTLPFKVPAGFRATLFSDETPGARVLAHDPAGGIVVSLTSEGKILSLFDQDGDGRAEAPFTILEGLDRPHGILFLCAEGLGEEACTLYVAEEKAVRVFAYDKETRTAHSPETLLALPAGGRHRTRTLELSADNKSLLVSVGSTCDVCNESDARHGSIISVDIKSGEWELFARGLRNTVFMTRHPVTGEVWGADMGRDNLGDDLPPDEVNIIRAGGNYGWPICFGKNVHDAEFDKNVYIRNPCQEPTETPSHIDIPAHSAPLGLVFVPEEGWPEEYWFDLLVSYHGSWNKSDPTGYTIVRMNLDERGNPNGPVEDFMTGFRSESGEVVGRPTGLLIEPGGVLYVADDRAGAVYRISRTSL